MAAAVCAPSMTRPSFHIQRRAGATDDSSDPFSNFEFSPARESDELFDALRIAYPNIKSHNERLFKAIIDHQSITRLEEKSKRSAAAAVGDTISSLRPQCITRSQQSSVDSHAVSETPSHRMALHSMTQAFSLDGRTKPRTKRPMTEDELEDYRLTKRVGACERCRKRKRKCPHRIAEADPLETKRRKLSLHSEDNRSPSPTTRPVVQAELPAKGIQPNTNVEVTPVTLESNIFDDLASPLAPSGTQAAIAPQLAVGAADIPNDLAMSLDGLPERNATSALIDPTGLSQEPGHDETMAVAVQEFVAPSVQDFAQSLPWDVSSGGPALTGTSASPQFDIMNFSSIPPMSPWNTAFEPEALPQLGTSPYVQSVPASPELQSRLSWLHEILNLQVPISDSLQSETPNSSPSQTVNRIQNSKKDPEVMSIDEFVNFDDQLAAVDICSQKRSPASCFAAQADNTADTPRRASAQRKGSKDSSDTQLKKLLRGLEEFCRQMNDSVKTWETIYPDPETVAPAVKGDKREMSNRYIIYDRETRRAWLLDDRVVRSLTMLLGVAHLMGSVFSKQPPQD